MILLFIAFIVSILLSWILYFRSNPELNKLQKSVLVVTRAIVWSLVFVFLLTPVINYIRKLSERPEIVFLKDVSESMRLEQQNISKLEKSEAAYDKMKKSYKEKGYDVKEYVFADGLSGAKNTTYLIPALEKILQLHSKSPLHGIILFSDGWFRDLDLSSIKDFQLPIVSVVDTTSFALADLEVAELKHNKQGYRNELTAFQAQIKSTGFSGEASVSFYADGKVVSTKKISFKDEPVQSVDFSTRFKALGLHKVDVRVIPEGYRESHTQNNFRSSAIDILSDKDKIVLITDVLNWDTRFILDTIRENNRLEAISLIVKNRELYEGDARSSFNEWDKVSTIVIVNGGALSMNNALAQRISGRVKQGCGLLYFGMPINELAGILPLKQTNIRSQYEGIINILKSAAMYAAFQIPESEFNQIPPVDYYYVTSSPGAEVLAVMDNAQKSPAIAVSTVSDGRVIAFSMLNLWRWQLQSKGGYYKEFIRSLLKWSGKHSADQLSALFETSYFLDEQIEIKLSALDELRETRLAFSPRITVLDSQNDNVFDDFMIYDNDEYKIRFRLQKPGDYSFKITGGTPEISTSGRFMVQEQNLEQKDIGYNIPTLSWMSLQTDGKLLDLSSASSYSPVKAVRRDRIEKTEFPLYKKWYFIILFLLTFCLELYLRRRWGLL